MDRQWRVIEGKLLELRHAQAQRGYWHRLTAREVLEDPELLAVVRRCGVGEITAADLGALIGDIQRFANPKKLVKYIGFNPAFDESDQSDWSGGIGGHAHRFLRSLFQSCCLKVGRFGNMRRFVSRRDQFFRLGEARRRNWQKESCVSPPELQDNQAGQWTGLI